MSTVRNRSCTTASGAPSCLCTTARCSNAVADRSINPLTSTSWSGAHRRTKNVRRFGFKASIAPKYQPLRALADLSLTPGYDQEGNLQCDPNAKCYQGVISQTPDAAQTNPGLGGGGPRVVQLGLKVVF